MSCFKGKIIHYSHILLVLTKFGMVLSLASFSGYRAGTYQQWAARPSSSRISRHFTLPAVRHAKRGQLSPARKVSTQVAVDEAPVWTLDQSVGLVFGFLLLGIYLSSSTLDKWIAKAQRRQLGLCEECGGLYDPQTCSEKECPSRKNS